MKDDLVYLKHIADAIVQIEKYIEGMSFESFTQDDKTVDAVVKRLEIIGEAMNNLSDEFVTLHPQLPQRDAIEMRNVLIHEYFGINKKIVWDTCHVDLPALKTTMHSLTK